MQEIAKAIVLVVCAVVLALEFIFMFAYPMYMIKKHGEYDTNRYEHLMMMANMIAIWLYLLYIGLG